MSGISRGPSARAAQGLLARMGPEGWLEIVRRYGNSFQYQGTLATCEPEIVRELLTHREHTLRRSRTYRAMSRLVPGAPGLLFMDGEPWRQHLRAVMPVFTRANVDSYARYVHETAVAYASGWRDGERLPDLFTALTELGMEVVLRVGYGLDPHDALARSLGRELIGYKSQTMRPRYRLDTFGMTPRQIVGLSAIAPSLLALRARVGRLRSIVRAIIERRDARNGHRPDWIGQLHGAGLSLSEITDELNHLYGAFTAGDFVITCAFYELSRHPRWADILRDELRGALGDRAYPTRDDFPTLPRTIGFMKEVLRRYPVAMAVARRTGEPLAVGGTVLPSGSEALLLLYALHHHPGYWDNPAQFNPARWQGSREPHAPYAYVPFLTGSRQCIGRHLVELNFVIVMNALLQRYDVAVLDHTVGVNRFLIPRFERAIPCVVQCRRG